MEPTDSLKLIRTEAERARTLIVAVSGGADSVVTLHLAAQVAAQNTRLKLIAWYLHHYTTPLENARARAFESLSAKLAEQLAERFEFVRQQADVMTISRRTGYSWEHAASLLRRKYLLRLRSAVEFKTGEPAIVLTGHNYSDFLETLSLRKERQLPDAALPSLRAKDPETEFLRPLYRIDRDGVREYAREFALPYYDDPSNADEHIARNRLRKRSEFTEPPVAEERTGFQFRKHHRRELRMSDHAWLSLPQQDRARTVFAAFRRLAICRKFTRSHFSRAHSLPFNLPPFFAHAEATRGENQIIFRRGLGASVALPAAETTPYLRGNAVTRKITFPQPYGHKSVGKIFSEKKLSPRERRRTIVYLKAAGMPEAVRIDLPPREGR